MTDAAPLDSTHGTGSTVARQVMEALRSGGGVASLRPILDDAALSPEQRDVIEFLEFLDELDETKTQDSELNALTANSDDAQLEAMRNEIADLREVNDVTAGALGACRVCWGGDEYCPLCAGQGAPGASLPDLRLYNELVRPAVERMTAMRAATPRSVRFPDEEAQQ